MDIIQAVQNGLKVQGINNSITECPVNITLKSGIILNACYLEEETQDLLIVSETTRELKEEIRVINKDDISYLAVIYLTPGLYENTDKENNMYM